MRHQSVRRIADAREAAPAQRRGARAQATRATMGRRSQRVPAQDLRSVPHWVRRFFHGNTFRHALALRDELVEKRDWFLLACLLGILHHQRPGFLSYPAVIWCRISATSSFREASTPSLYEERDVLSRMEAKVRRTFRRPPSVLTDPRCTCATVEPQATGRVNAIITSPPYMNELDYVRDNRLRLWFLDRDLPDSARHPKARSRGDISRPDEDDAHASCGVDGSPTA